MNKYALTIPIRPVSIRTVLVNAFINCVLHSLLQKHLCRLGWRMLLRRILLLCLSLTCPSLSIARPIHFLHFSVPSFMSESDLPSPPSEADNIVDRTPPAAEEEAPVPREEEPPITDTLFGLGLGASGAEEPSSSTRARVLENINVLPTEPQDWGILGKLTALQQETLDKFLAQVNPEFIDAVRYTVETKQQTALRFLRARQFDAEKSKILLTAANKKLVELKAKECSMDDGDTNANCDVKALISWYPHTMYGYDKFKRPILWEWNGGMNVNAITQMTTKEGLIKYHLWTMEKVLDDAFTRAKEMSSLDSGDKDELCTISTCVVLDFNGFGVNNINSKTLDHCKTLVGIDNVVYPETLGKMFVINAPWVITTTWDIVKTWLDPRTQAKICILGSGPETTKKLLEVIPIEVLPKQVNPPHSLCAPRHSPLTSFFPRYRDIYICV